MKSWKAILATLVIFAAGLMTGAVIIKKSQASAPRPVSPEIFFQGPYYIQKHFLGRMKSELALDESQSLKVEKIFADSRERIRILLDIVGPELRTELTAVHQAIQKELTPAQQSKFEELLRKTRPGRFGGSSVKDSHRSRERDADRSGDPRRPDDVGSAKPGPRRPPTERPPSGPPAPIAPPP